MATDKNTLHYTSALQRTLDDLRIATLEYERVEERAEELRNKIATLRRVAAGLSELTGKVVPAADMGLTEAVTSVMEQARRAMRTTEVIKELEHMGVDLSGQKNAKASVAKVLARLATAQKVARIVDVGGSVWIGPNHPVGVLKVPPADPEDGEN